MTKTVTKESGFLAKLKSKCKRCSPASIQVYFRNVKRLHKLISDEDIPATGAWLSKKQLFDKFAKLPLSQRRALSVAGVKAMQSYGKDVEKWTSLMYKAQNEYVEGREKNEKTDVEKKKWPKGGYAAIGKGATEMKRRIRHVLKDEPSLPGLYKYQLFIILKLFADLPFRNTFADMRIREDSAGN